MRMILNLGIGVIATLATTMVAMASDRSPVPLTQQRTVTVVEAGGAVRQRDYRLYAPGWVRSPAPLVIVMHGGMQNAGQALRQSGANWARLARDRGFLVAFPEGRARGENGAGAQRYWNDCQRTGPSASRHSDWDDVAFISTLIDDLDAQNRVDVERVYATGVSNGGNMAIRLAFELDDRIAGFAPSISYGPPVGNPELNECRTQPQFKRPILLTYGTRDRLNPPHGTNGCRNGDCADGSAQSVEDFIAFWSDWLETDERVERAIPDRVRSDGPRNCETRGSSTQTRIDYRRDGRTLLQIRRVNCGGHAEPGEFQYSWRARLIVGWRNLDAPAPDYIADFFGL